jgi:hypothetical protein
MNSQTSPANDYINATTVGETSGPYGKDQELMVQLKEKNEQLMAQLKFSARTQSSGSKRGNCTLGVGNRIQGRERESMGP